MVGGQAAGPAAGTRRRGPSSVRDSSEPLALESFKAMRRLLLLLLSCPTAAAMRVAAPHPTKWLHSNNATIILPQLAEECVRAIARASRALSHLLLLQPDQSKRHAPPLDLADQNAWSHPLNSHTGLELARQTVHFLVGVQPIRQPSFSEAEAVFRRLTGGVWTSVVYLNGDARLKAHGYPQLVRLAMLKTRQSIEYTGLIGTSMQFTYVAAGLAKMKSEVHVGGAPLESSQFGEVLVIYTTVTKDSRLVEVKYGYPSKVARQRNEIAWKQYSITSIDKDTSTTDEFTLARPSSSHSRRDGIDVVRSQSIYKLRLDT